MRSSVKDKAIILRRKSFGEADWMLTLFTERHGKLRVVAKGARRLTSRLAGFSELFTVISCQINFHSSIPIVSQITHEQLLDGVADNRQLYRSLHILAEVVDKATHEDDAQPAFFAYVSDAMRRLVADSRPTTLSEVLVGITRQLGLVPQCEICSVCGQVIREEDNLVWDVTHGGLVHARDRQQSLDQNAVKVLRALIADRLPQGLVLSGELASQTERRLLNHIQFAIDRELVSVGD